MTQEEIDRYESDGDLRRPLTGHVHRTRVTGAVTGIVLCLFGVLCLAAGAGALFASLW